MFLSLAKLLQSAGSAREDVFLIHPVQLSRWLDEAWKATALVPELPVGSPPTGPPALGSSDIVDALGLPVQMPQATLLPSGIDPADVEVYQHETSPNVGPGLIHHHLVYAYVLESTGTWEIFSALIRRLVIGETLGPLTAEATTWARATEELFFRDPPLFSITGIVSELRPYSRISRRNAYWRMFGLDLPHPIPPRWAVPGSGTPWKEDVGGGVNTDFRAKWSELLRQVWLGLENDSNSSGADPTDPAFVAFICTAIKDMLNDRRRGGLLAREEFAYVTAMSWFHLTLQSNTPILVSLKADAASPAERLAKLGSHVGMTPSQRSRELFLLAEPMSSVLRAIELGSFDDASTASTLFDASTALGREMRELVNLWQSATGERVKERPSGTTISGGAQPLRIPTPRTDAVSAPVIGGPGAGGRTPTALDAAGNGQSR